jgi:hypothetical protein
MNNLLTYHSLDTGRQLSRTPSFDILLTPDSTITATSPAWIVAFTKRVEEILSLPPNWDGEDARAIDVSCVIEALDFLFSALSHDTPAPQVVPTAEGGLQLEWHTKGLDLEVTFLPATRASFFFACTNSPDFEGDVNDHVMFVSSTLRTLRSLNDRSPSR